MDAGMTSLSWESESENSIVVTRSVTFDHSLLRSLWLEKLFPKYTNSKFRQFSLLSIDQAHQPDDSGEVSCGAEVDQLSLIRYNNLVISLQFFY